MANFFLNYFNFIEIVFGKYLLLENFLLAKKCFGKISFCEIFFYTFFLFRISLCCNFFLVEYFVSKIFVVEFVWQLEYVQDGPRNLPLKFGQNWVNNSWDIPDMDKCRKDKCCLNKCHFESWNMLKKVPGTFKIWWKLDQ